MMLITQMNVVALMIMLTQLTHCRLLTNKAGSNRFIVNDLTHVHKEGVTQNRPGTGTLYYVSDSILEFAEWEIYFDSSMTKIAARSVPNENGTTITNFWENGALKGSEIFKEGRRSHIEYYCENGTLVNRQKLTLADYSGNCFHKSDTVYYCNGNLMSTYDMITRVYTFWYENGQKALEGTEVNCMNNGTWTEYDTSGKAIFYRYYKNGDMTGTDSIH